MPCIWDLTPTPSPNGEGNARHLQVPCISFAKHLQVVPVVFKRMVRIHPFHALSCISPYALPLCTFVSFVFKRMARPLFLREALSRSTLERAAKRPAKGVKGRSFVFKLNLPFSPDPKSKIKNSPSLEGNGSPTIPSTNIL